MVFNKQMLKLFFYWMNERHSIYKKKTEKKPFPWTKDPILSTYKFTNVYRQLDRVTVEWGSRYAKLLMKSPKPAEIIFHCAMFRMFNWPETYDALSFGMSKWNLDKAMKILQERQGEGLQVFTGAYIIPNVGRTDPKIQVICEALNVVHEMRGDIAQALREKPSLKLCTELLMKVPTIGPFIAYEIACDLRFTKVLDRASDIHTWANAGPGAKRGIHRLLNGGAHTWTGKKPDYLKAMRELLLLAPKHFDTEGGEFPFELREIEHSLCEFDKYLRVKFGEGKPRSLYKTKEK